MKIILIGPPGSGKGTQAELICKRYNIVHISTGDIFRENIKNKTPLGLKIKSIIDSGKLVDDSLTIEIVKNRLNEKDAKNGFCLDGFPRTIEQAKALDEFAKIDKAIEIDLDDKEIVSRLSKRRMCLVCGNPTHVDLLKNGRCEKCGGEVYTREDDKEETILKRLKSQKLPKEVWEYYKNKNILCSFKSDASKEELFCRITKVLDQI